ncbi:hypothetical protein PUN28_005769 [Cardiocondyla obscurior]|uniref:Uncharacterized protein n=1 Tax=Cardiocondyla obscurior TaxID=286306 RepID=A0AAW2GB23_9HYME
MYFCAPATRVYENFFSGRQHELPGRATGIFISREVRYETRLQSCARRLLPPATREKLHPSLATIYSDWNFFRLRIMRSKPTPSFEIKNTTLSLSLCLSLSRSLLPLFQQVLITRFVQRLRGDLCSRETEQNTV